MINSINLLLLRHAEYLQFMSNFLSLVESNDPALLNVVTQYNALKAKVGEIEDLFKTDRASATTQEIIGFDENRDRDITGITTVIDGYCYYFESEKAEAANLLSHNLKLYGAGIYKQNYQAETALLKEIINDWETKPELVAALSLLGLVDWKNDLKANNESFNAKFLARTQEYGAASPETLKQKRDETTAVYYDLRKFLDAYATINNTPLYTKTTNDLNALIEQYNTVLNNRLSDETTEGNTEEGDTTDIGDGEIVPNTL